MTKKAMIWIFLFIASVFCAVFLLHAEKGPKITFKKSTWNVGNIKQGKSISHVFEFKNTGDSTLEIKKVRTTCGCTAALISKKEIKPGKSGEIKVTLNTRGYSGNLSKYVYVESNDPSQPTKQLTVMASIEVPPSSRINLERYSQDIGLMLESEAIQSEAKIQNRGELELEVVFSHKDAEFYHKGKKISSPLKVASGKEALIEIKMPPRDRVGLIREYILLRTNDPMRPNLSYYISGYIVTKHQLKELFKKYKHIVD